MARYAACPDWLVSGLSCADLAVDWRVRSILERDQVSEDPDARLVFVSHSGADTWVAKQIAREISGCGAKPFLDEAELDVGADFEEDILAFLARADELVVLLTPWALERPYVWAELGAAWGRRIPIIGVLHGISVGELQARPGVPVFLKKRDLLPLNDIDTYLAQLRSRATTKSAARPAGEK